MFNRMYLTAESNVSVVCEMQCDALLLLFSNMLKYNSLKQGEVTDEWKFYGFCNLIFIFFYL